MKSLRLFVFYSSDDDDDDDNYDDEDDEHDSDSDEDDEEEDFLRTLLLPSLLNGEVRFGPQNVNSYHFS